jgi:2-keto-4-pentenoate hydratase
LSQDNLTEDFAHERGPATLSEAFFDAHYAKVWRLEKSSPQCLAISEAYQVQNQVCEKRIARGESVVGYKVGCTSRAIRSQLGLAEPISARLFAPHVTGGRIAIDWTAYCHCAIEPEMVLRIGQDLFGTDLSDEELIQSISYVSPGIELHDYKFWHQPPTAQELICSGGIHAGLIVGDAKVSPQALTFGREKFFVYQNNDLVASSRADEIMGGPLESLRWLVNFMSSNDEVLKKGMLVIPGSPTELISITGDSLVRVEIDNLGTVEANFRSQSPSPR